ncbi:MAG: DnaJ domain-containing protein [Bacteroidota bacterium]
MSNIEKSTVLVQKENELAQLQTKRKKILTQLKRNKTILQKIQDEIVDIQQKMAGIPDALMEIQALKEELGDLFRQAEQADTIPEEEKEGMDEFAKEFDQFDIFEELMGMSAEEFKRMRAEGGQETDEFDRKRAFDVFQQFEVETPEARKRDIRKAYVQLAQRFHPDRARSEKEKKEFHLLMQQLNAAYERNDLATLLTLNEKYATSETLLEKGQVEENTLIDVVDAAIDRVNSEIAGLEAQLKRLKKEIKRVRQSELGDMHRVEKEAQRYGEGDTEDMLESLAEQKAYFEQMIKGMKVYIKTGEMPEELHQMIAASEMEDNYYFDDEMEEITIDDLLSAFADFMDEEDQKTKKRKR